MSVPEAREGPVSRSGSAPCEHDHTDIPVKMQGSRRKSFWHGILQGLSGPAMLADRPRVVDTLVEIGSHGVHLNRLGRQHIRSRPDALGLARALAQATAEVGHARGLTTSAEAVSRLDPADGSDVEHRVGAQRPRNHDPR